MATHSSVLAWEIPWTEEPGGTLRGVTRVRHDWATKQQQAALAAAGHALLSSLGSTFPGPEAGLSSQSLLTALSAVGSSFRSASGEYHSAVLSGWSSFHLLSTWGSSRYLPRETSLPLKGSLSCVISFTSLTAPSLPFHWYPLADANNDPSLPRASDLFPGLTTWGQASLPPSCNTLSPSSGAVFLCPRTPASTPVRMLLVPHIPQRWMLWLSPLCPHSQPDPVSLDCMPTIPTFTAPALTPSLVYPNTHLSWWLGDWKSFQG